MKTVVLVWIALITLPLAIYGGALVLPLILMHPLESVYVGILAAAGVMGLIHGLIERRRWRPK